MVFENAVFIKPDVNFKREYTGRNYAPMFRKSIYLNSTEDALLYVCGLGYGYYYINGKPVSADLFTAPVSDYRKTLWYNKYTVSKFLKQGWNTIAVICGNGWYNEEFVTKWHTESAKWRDLPKFILRLEIAGETVLVTDDTWRCSPDSAIFFNALRSGEYFNSNLYEPDWIKEGYDDSLWQYAAKDTTPPTGKFRECMCEPIREHEIYKPVKIYKTGKFKYVFDMGQNISGYVRLTVCGKKGDVLTIRYSELLDPDKSLNINNMNRLYLGQSPFMTDKFICSGKRFTWSPRFAYHGFRYIEIDGVRDIDDIEVQSVFVHQAVERRTSCECSDELINKLFDMGIKSSWSNMFYSLTDCPTREKFGWTNDAQASCEQMLTNFSIENLLLKWHRDILDAMLPDGSLPGIVPTAGWGYGWGNGPVSDGVLFEIPYRVYLHTGNSEPLVSSIEYFDRYLDYLDKKADEKGLVDFGLGDWACPGLKDDIPVTFINTVLMYKFNYISGLAAKLSGSGREKHYQNNMDRLKLLINDIFTDESGRCIIDRQTAVAMLIYNELGDNKEALAQQLKELVEKTDYHISCGMVGMRRLLIALNESERHKCFRAKHQNVKGVLVVGVGARYKAVICRIMSRGVEDTVHFDVTRVLVELILYLAALADLDDRIKTLRTYPFGTYVVPDVFHSYTSAVRFYVFCHF